MISVDDTRQALVEIRDFVRECRAQRIEFPDSAFQTFRINRRTFRARLAGQIPKKQPQREALASLADAIRRDPSAVINRLMNATGKVVAAPGGDPAALMLDAQPLSEQQRSAEAVALARYAFERLAEARLDDAVLQLPRLLYLLVRYGTARQTYDTLEDTVLPLLNGCRKTVLMKATVRDATLAMCAMGLNEGGEHQMSGELFALPSVYRLRDAGGDHRWIASALMRNHAHHLAWYGARDVPALEMTAETRRRDRSASNQVSCANTLCEIHLACCKPKQAWDAIHDRYATMRTFLDAHVDRTHRQFVGTKDRFQHGVAGFMLGAFARARWDDAYRREALVDDLNLLDALLDADVKGRLRKPLRLGYRLPPDSVRQEGHHLDRLYCLEEQVQHESMPKRYRASFKKLIDWLVRCGT